MLPPAIEWALTNRARVAALVLLNTYYARSPTLKPPEAIARYSKPGLWRDIQVFGAMRSDSRWQSGFLEQISKFFANGQAREKYVPVLAHQSLGIRSAFFGLNAVLRAEVEARDARRPELQTFDRPVRIVFGAADPYLNIGVARDLATLFPRSEVFTVKDAAHYVQLDRPARVAELILAAPTD